MTIWDHLGTYVTAVTNCGTSEKLQNCPFIAKKGKNIAKKGKYEPSSAFDSVTICDHCDQLITPHTTSYHIAPHLGAPVDGTPYLDTMRMDHGTMVLEYIEAHGA